MPVKRLPLNPNLDHLRYHARDLLRDQAARNPGAAQRIREFQPRFNRASDAEIFDAPLSLSALSSQSRASRDFRVGQE